MSNPTIYQTPRARSTKQPTPPTKRPRRRSDPKDLSLFDKTNKWIDNNLPTLLRLSIGLPYLWFGAVKFVPGQSPAEPLVRDVIDQISALIPLISIPSGPAVLLLALWETVIGIGLIIGRKQRIVLTSLALQLTGTAIPVILLPNSVWTSFPLVLTLEGQFIVKNLIILTAAMAYSRTISNEEKLFNTGSEEQL